MGAKFLEQRAAFMGKFNDYYKKLLYPLWFCKKKI